MEDGTLNIRGVNIYSMKCPICGKIMEPIGFEKRATNKIANGIIDLVIHPMIFRFHCPYCGYTYRLYLYDK